VLLLGETGVGKEVVARAIHEGNPSGHFVPIDCGSLVGPLMESELFGHAKGAFTGASEAKRGLIDLANGGTAFFDEIGDLPLELQVKLLRVLQEREYRPVGSLVRQKVNLRVISATHRDLPREVARGTFRQDLYYRLNVISVHIPALRDRKDDIPALTRHFLSLCGANYSMTNETQEAMLAYDWPGNVRELQHVIERAVITSTGGRLNIELPSQAKASHSPEAASANPVVRTDAQIRQIEADNIRAALKAANGKVSGTGGAAQLLGLKSTTLASRIKALGINLLTDP
jgi:transcriptional regulator with GAF, ATPase, and Fis domain